MKLPSINASVAKLINEHGQILLLRKSDDHTWGLPGGKQDGEEQPRDTLIRELFEETNLIINYSDLDLVSHPRYDETEHKKHNNRVQCFRVRNWKGEIKLSSEHDQYQWIEPRKALKLNLTGTLTRSYLVEEINRTRMFWPLKNKFPIFPDEPGDFAAIRKHDIHTGIDLYCEPNSSVITITGGTIVCIEEFTGIKAGTPFWNDTKAIHIQIPGGQIYIYGELEPIEGLEVGQYIGSGQIIGTILPVLKKNKGRPRHMLHFEIVDGQKLKTSCSVWKHDEPHPSGLIDPWNILMLTTGGVYEYYDKDKHKNLLGENV